MEQKAFLEQHIYKGLKQLKPAESEEYIGLFSEEDFAVILERAAYYGMSIYTIESWENDAIQQVMNHEDMKKKATDEKWYSKAFKTMRMGEPGQSYTARCKVSKKLLARES